MAKQIASSNSKPGAWIVSSTDKGRKSIKNGKVFLNDGDEFEIELFNPLTVSVLADIKLNGQSISKTGLVVKPGQRVYLDCFIDDRKKFKFSTYEIENSGESLDATQNNGLLEVFFYKEDVITLDNWQRRFDRIIVEKWYPYYPSYPYYRPTVWCLTTNPYNSVITTNGSGIIGTTTTSNAHYSSNSIVNCSYTSGVDLSNLNISGSNNMTNINSIETGRVEKGDKSKQNFTNSYENFKYYTSHEISFKIQPLSTKNKTTEDIRHYCTECGTKIKSNFKFCPTFFACESSSHGFRYAKTCSRLSCCSAVLC